MLNIATLLESSVREYPRQTAIVFQDTRLNYAQLNATASPIANGLKAAGIQKADRVALSPCGHEETMNRCLGEVPKGPIDVILELCTKHQDFCRMGFLQEAGSQPQNQKRPLSILET